MAVALLAGLTTGTAWGQQGTAATDMNPAETRQAKSASLNEAGLFKASDLIGLDVRGNGGEDLGEIEDFTIDAKTGKVQYAAVSMGGFLGIGDKLVAVPWDSFQIQMNREGDDVKLAASLNIDKNRMKTAQGFDEEHWPASADRTWQTADERRLDVDVDVDVERQPVE